jgi:hypothetical protein
MKRDRDGKRRGPVTPMRIPASPPAGSTQKPTTSRV